MGFSTKKKWASFLGSIGVSELLLKRLNRKYNNQYIRILNYHTTPSSTAANFEKQISWYKEWFDNINYAQFETFMETGKLPGNKPGIMITFDDGFENNYTVAKEILEKHGMTGYFMVPVSALNTKGYMSYEQVRNLVAKGHIITDHTSTHHRMKNSDSEDILTYEIAISKIRLEEILGTSVDIFTWVGGEESHYTKPAQDFIKKSGFKYGFMTNSAPLFQNTDRFLIHRSNIESNWDLALVKFQLCGIEDRKLKAKRKRVEKLMQD